METYKIVMPRLGVNEDTVTLGQWLVEQGAYVKKGQAVAVIETSKETSEVKAGAEGYLSILAKAGNDVPVGASIAELCQSALKNEERSLVEKEETNHTFTKKAKEFLEKHPEIDMGSLPREGIIKEQDLAKLISEPYHIEKTMSNRVLIYGRGGICKDAIEIINQTKMYQLDGIVDFYYPQDKELYGIPVVGGPGELEKLYQEGYHKLFSAVAFWGETYTKHYRKNPYSRFKKIGYELVNLVDRTANIASTVQMGEGNLICGNTFVGPDAILGSNIIVNVGAIVNHDCIVSDHCHIASGAVLAGEVIIGENTLVGQGAVIHAGVKVGNNVVINNGCRIFKDVPDNKIVDKS